MGSTEQLIIVWECERCHHRWIARDWDKPKADQVPPLVCAKCKSPYYNRPRQSEASEKPSTKPKPAKKSAKKRAKK